MRPSSSDSAAIYEVNAEEKFELALKTTHGYAGGPGLLPGQYTTYISCKVTKQTWVPSGGCPGDSTSAQRRLKIVKSKYVISSIKRRFSVNDNHCPPD
jgi:hypothetical protein